MPPITFYADMADWIDLAEGRVDSGPLAKAIADARIVPVLSLVHFVGTRCERKHGWEGTGHRLYRVASGGWSVQVDQALPRRDPAGSSGLLQGEVRRQMGFPGGVLRFVP